MSSSRKYTRTKAHNYTCYVYIKEEFIHSELWTNCINCLNLPVKRKVKWETVTMLSKTTGILLQTICLPAKAVSRKHALNDGCDSPINSHVMLVLIYESPILIWTGEKKERKNWRPRMNFDWHRVRDKNYAL